MCVYTFSCGHVCSFMHMYVEAKSPRWVSSTMTVHLNFLERISWWTWFLLLSCQQALGIHLFLPPFHQVLCCRGMPNLFVSGCWRPKCGRRFYLVTLLSSSTSCWLCINLWFKFNVLYIITLCSWERHDFYLFENCTSLTLSS